MYTIFLTYTCAFGIKANLEKQVNFVYTLNVFKSNSLAFTKNWIDLINQHFFITKFIFRFI